MGRRRRPPPPPPPPPPFLLPPRTPRVGDSGGEGGGRRHQQQRAHRPRPFRNQTGQGVLQGGGDGHGAGMEAFSGEAADVHVQVGTCKSVSQSVSQSVMHKQAGGTIITTCLPVRYSFLQQSHRLVCRTLPSLAIDYRDRCLATSSPSQWRRRLSRSGSSAKHRVEKALIPEAHNGFSEPSTKSTAAAAASAVLAVRHGEGGGGQWQRGIG